MPAWGLALGTLAKSRAGVGIWWLLKLVGIEKVIEIVWKAIERAVSRIGDRGAAIRKARHTRDGTWAPVVVEGRTRWVVYSGTTPIDMFPAPAGDLVAAMQTFDTDRLRDPADVPSARTMEWVRDRLGALRGRDDTDDAGHEAGGARFHELVDDLPGLLERLTSAPATSLARREEIPAGPGVYLFRDGVNPIRVGGAADLRVRLRELEADARLAEMQVQFVEFDDPVARTIFEVYAARALGTDECNGSEAAGPDRPMRAEGVEPTRS